jgi:hypothetical protein
MLIWCCRSPGAGCSTWRGRRPEALPRRVGPGVVYLALTLLYMLGLLGSNSRGPMLGFSVGALVLAALVATISGRKSVVLTAVGLAVAGGTALVWIRLSPAPADPASALRAGQMLNLQEGSGRVRVLLWESAGRLITHSVGRTLVGYGPETALLVFQRLSASSPGSSSATCLPTAPTTACSTPQSAAAWCRRPPNHVFVVFVATAYAASAHGRGDRRCLQRRWHSAQRPARSARSW